MGNPYRDALDYLYGFTDYGKLSGYTYSPERFDLRRVDRLLALLDDPHRTFRSVHVAGTKGKGSTCAMIASVLQQAGYRVGLYTSPHLHSFRERIQVDGELVSRQEIVDGVRRLREAAPRVEGITTFELITALGFSCFAQRNCEWAVVEVGMGGRLDATNVIVPQVSVITAISYDHMMYLGNSLAEIAGEKAGIIKRGVPVIAAPQPDEALRVIQNVADERGCALVVVGRDWRWQSTNSAIESLTEGQRFVAWQDGRRADARAYQIPLLGRHQLQNAVTALSTLAYLRETGVALPDRAVRDGLARVRWPGRLEVLGRKPWVVVDGAHNGASMQKLRVALRELFPESAITLVYGVSADKDIDAMLDEILPIVDRVLVTRAHHPRAADPASLAERIRARGVEARAVPIEDALAKGLRLSGDADLICATGSLFVVSEFRRVWFERDPAVQLIVD